MSTALRVLYVDDEPGLLGIGKVFLEKEGVFAVDTLTSARLALEQLKTAPYDAIVSDYLMPEMDGITFLKQLKASGNTTPFIIFTGRGREEVVIEALNEGADFYLQKGGDPKAQFTELAHKIRSAVSRRRTEKLAKDTERRLYDIINFLPDATFAIDSGGKVIAWNRAIEEMTGVPAIDMLGKGDYEYAVPFYGVRRPILIDLVSIPDEELTRDRYAIVKKEGDILIAETTLPRPMGRYSILLGKASILYNDEGKGIGAIESIRDITDQKRGEKELRTKHDELIGSYEQLAASEEELRYTIDEVTRQEQALRESEEKFRDIFENSVMGLFKTAPDGRMINANDALARMYGYQGAAEILNAGVNVGQFYANPEKRKELLHILAEKGIIENFETPHLKRDGTRFWVSITARAILDTEGNVLFYEGTNIDITDSKRVEEALIESETNYRQLVETTTDWVWKIDLEGYYTYSNSAIYDLLGFNVNEIVGSNAFPLIHPDDEQLIREMLKQCTDQKTGWQNVAIRWLHKDGSVRLFESSASPIINTDGQVTGFSGIDRNITERKEAEAALQRKSITLSILNEIISTANKSDDLPQLLNSILDESIRLLDFDSGGIYLVDHPTRTATVFLSKNLPPEFLSEIQVLPIDKKPYDKLFIQNEPIITENYAEISPEYSKKYGFHSMASIPLISKGVAIGALNIASTRRYVISEEEKTTLISIGRELGSTIERMASEEEAKKARDNLETLFNSIDEMVFVLDMQGNILAANDAVSKLLLYKPGELTGTNVLLLHVPERRDEALLIVQGMIAGTIDSCPVPVLAKDGTRIEVETKITRGWWDNQEVLIGVTRDITERKMAEDELVESERKYQGLFAAESDGIVVVDRKTGIIIDCNNAFPPMYGYHKEEVIGQLNTAISADPDIMQVTTKAGTGHIPVMYHKRKDGSVFPVEITANVLSLQGREVVIAAVRDITELRRAEEAIRQANRKLTLLSGITRHDINNQLTMLRGYLAILEEKHPDPALDEYFQKVATAAERISSMIRFTKEYEEIGLHAPVWQDCRTLVDTAAKEAPLGHVRVANDLPASSEVFADPLIMKVFYNLMDNAARYGGKITTIRFSALESGGNHILVCEDNGSGVPGVEKEQIFAPGFGKNTGLGLALSREILSITGITIHETGKPGNGARFEMTVPKEVYRVKIRIE